MELPLVCLGYASIPLRKGKPTLRVHFKQSISKADYIQYLYSVFYPFVGTPPRGRSPRGAGPARVYQSIYFQTFRHNVASPPFTSNSIINFSISTINTTVYAGKKELLKIFIKACKSARLLVHGRWLLYVQQKSNL